MSVEELDYRNWDNLSLFDPLKASARSALTEQYVMAQVPEGLFGYKNPEVPKPTTLEEYLNHGSHDRATKITKILAEALVDLLDHPGQMNVHFLGDTGLIDFVEFRGGHVFDINYKDTNSGVIDSITMDGKTVNFSYRDAIRGDLQSIGFGNHVVEFPLDSYDPGQVIMDGKPILRNNKKIAYHLYDYLSGIKQAPDTVVFPGTEK